MKTLLVVLTFGLAMLSVSPVAEARLGGGRSFGSRGYRSVNPRPYAPSAPRREAAPPNRFNPSQPYAPNPSRFGGGGGFMRGMVGGLAGGLLGSMLFRGLGYGGMGYGGGGGGIGLLEILLIAGVGFFLFRWMRNRQGYASGTARPVSPLFSPEVAEAEPVEAEPAESSAASVLQRYDGQFDLSQFKESRIDDFFKMQAAFSNRDLSSVRDRLTPEMQQTLERDVADLKSSGKINRLENIAVREAEVIEAWQELGKEYATVRLRANLVDYTVDESGNLVSGSKTEPVKFEEYWTYARDIAMGSQTGSGGWKLSAIEATA